MLGIVILGGDGCQRNSSGQIPDKGWLCGGKSGRAIYCSVVEWPREINLPTNPFTIAGAVLRGRHNFLRDGRDRRRQES